MDVNQQTEQYFKQLSNHFINSITTQVNQRVLDSITVTINSFDVKKEIDSKIQETVAGAIAAYRSADLAGAAAVGQNMVTQFHNDSASYLEALKHEIKTRVFDYFKQKVNDIDISALIREQCNIAVRHAVEAGTLNLPERSVPSSAINTDSLEVSANNILPGVIQKFTSTGIQDLSTECQVTITDQFTILENKIIAQDLEVKGTLTIGDLSTQGFADSIASLAVAKIEATYSDGTFDQYVHRVLTKLNEEGIAVDKLKLRDKPLIENGDSLNTNIIGSNLRSLGLLNHIEVAGESLFDDTLYVRSGKIGLNTMDPNYTIDIWDQEVQVILTKREKNAMFVGTVKPQKLVFGTNTLDQLILDPNGDILVQRITIGTIIHSSSPFQPTENKQVGAVVWNEQPAVGQPIGWVSLGGARWAKFGIISE